MEEEILTCSGLMSISTVYIFYTASNKVMVDRWAKQPSPYFSELGDKGEDLTLHGDLFKVEPFKEVGQKVSLVHQV